MKTDKRYICLKIMQNIKLAVNKFKYLDLKCKLNFISQTTSLYIGDISRINCIKNHIKTAH